MHKGFAIGARHVRVDLCDHGFGGFDRLRAIIAGQTEADIAPFIRRGTGKREHIDRQRAVAEQTRHIGKEHRGIIRAVLRDRLACQPADKQCVVAEMRLHAGLQVLARAEINHMRDLNLVELFRQARHCPLENDRFADRVAEHHPIAILDDRNCLLRRHRMLLIIGSPIH